METRGLNAKPREGTEVEFKAGFCFDPATGTNKVLRESVARAVCGFLNSNGGQVYIGIRDDGTVCGLEDEVSARFQPDDFDTFEHGVHEYLKQHLSPYPFGNIELAFEEIESKTVAVIKVKPVQFYVYLLKKAPHTDSNEIYVRTGNRTICLTDKARDKYVIERLGGIWMH
ncbi:ATP-binding protein [Coleofasciculus sp. LEGE 07081]|uniref:AlbA family DNA-binding domain-containing protein n=1 Tax=Coleofasciculus sp. LEGE 07081 TaxID=2777967 RepID=UPI001881C26C|nr:ATP-binding protein [Coleofasciculus sp. LEGE 07081]MBE9128312.1 ATP-binding protein [Coleofasciculus sp. LEGE 07081]